MIDLHSHSSYSDGTLSPEKLIDLAIKEGVTHLAITDHDNCQAMEPALKYALGKEISIIPGIELEVEFQPGEFHLLGLNLKRWDEDLQRDLDRIHQKRHQRNLSIIEKMKKLDMPISLGEVESFSKGEIIARPHFARAMMDRGWVKSVKEAFDKYLGPNKPLFVAKEAFQFEEAIDWVNRAGGVAILAHPLSLYLSWGRMPQCLKNLKDRGLQGIEAWHSGARLADANRFTTLAKELDLLITGGSDYHGKNAQGRRLGYGAGKQPLGEELLEGIL